MRRTVIFFIMAMFFLSCISFVSGAEVQFDEHSSVQIRDGKHIELVVSGVSPAHYVIAGESVQQYYVSTAQEYQIPYLALEPSIRVAVIEKLFPDDDADIVHWRHKVVYSGENYGGENLYRISMWFTGSGTNYDKLKIQNGLNTSVLRLGDYVLIPRELLFEELRSFLDRENERPGEPGTSLCSDLSYDQDAEGSYAEYHLKKGEALYSAVVMRFTGRILATEVNELALKIARRSGITDVTSIPVGYSIKIPIDFLIPEYLPSHDARHIAYIKNRAASKQLMKKISARNLSNVKVIIDSGHGGRDPGALGYYNLVEDEVVYDIACRIRKILLTQTNASVEFINFDSKQKYEPRDSETLLLDHNEYLMTTPTYTTGDSINSAHLRWYLANSKYRTWKKEKGLSDKIIFLSLHADALHPSANGALFYIPAAELRQDKYGKSGSFYKRFREYREQPNYTYASRDRQLSEAYSLRLAQSVLAALEKEKIAIHKRKPIREYIVRKNRTWVPAVLKYNCIPAKMLIEVANLKNKDDCKELKKPVFREKFAKAVVSGIIAYFE